MGAIGPGKTSIAAHISAEKAAYIDQRRLLRAWSRSEYTAAIIDLWFSLGCPELPIERNQPLPAWQPSKAKGGKTVD